ncbi:MAG: pentapeptide repeat-containing protein, partial [Actinobacteria bacterium]|jgi:uncharacterized protein YjbI with pentapeptide repeats|nr:pentapeptide repeat-containing protein [Actinomycetota bacterium]
VGVDLSYADLGGADFSDTQFEDVLLEGIRYDDATLWPADFVPPVSGGITDHE